jgi:hypothetical protein
LELKAGSHRITILVTKDAGDLASIRVELAEGSAQWTAP